MSSFINDGFSTMHIPNTFFFKTKTATDRHFSGLLHIICNFGIVAKTAGRGPDWFIPNINNRFLDLNCSTPTNSSVNSNELRSTKMVMIPGSRELLRRKKKNILFICFIYELLWPVQGIVSDPYSETYSVSIAVLGRSCVSFKKGEVCFSLSFQNPSVDKMSAP